MKADTAPFEALRVIRQREERAAEDALAQATAAVRVAQEAIDRADASLAAAQGATREARQASEAMMFDGAARWQIDGAVGFVARCQRVEAQRREEQSQARRALSEREAGAARARVALGEAMGRRKSVDDRLAAMRKAERDAAEAKAEEDASELRAAKRR